MKGSLGSLSTGVSDDTIQTSTCRVRPTTCLFRPTHVAVGNISDNQGIYNTERRGEEKKSNEKRKNEHEIIEKEGERRRKVRRIESTNMK